MGDPNSPYTPPPSSYPETSNLRMFYYGLAIVGTAAVVFAVYNLLIVKWCANNHRLQPRPPVGNISSSSQSFDDDHPINIAKLASSFKYKKEKVAAEGQQSHGYECSVCLSEFEDGEEVRELPKCKHCFHAQCIDMWLYSHLDCPLCRSPVEAPVRSQRLQQFENSQGLFDPSMLV